MYTTFLDEDAFKKISKEKLRIIAKMLEDMNSKSTDERIQILFTYGMELKSKGLSFTKDESSLLIDVLKVNLSESEKEKIDTFSQLLKTM